MAQHNKIKRSNIASPLRYPARNAPESLLNSKCVELRGSPSSVPARLGKGQGAKEIGHNLARERPKFGHNLVRKRRKIFYV